MLFYEEKQKVDICVSSWEKPRNTLTWWMIGAVTLPFAGIGGSLIPNESVISGTNFLVDVILLGGFVLWTSALPTFSMKWKLYDICDLVAWCWNIYKADFPWEGTIIGI